MTPNERVTDEPMRTRNHRGIEAVTALEGMSQTNP